MYLTKYSRDIPSLFDRNDFLPSLFNSLFDESPRLVDTTKIDVIEHDEKLEVLAEVPGYSKEDIKVEYEKGYLSITGEVKREKESDKKYLHKEIGSRSFARRFYLGTSIDKANISATFKDGILKIDLPKNEEEKFKQIEIN
jgi:HSP20 family protein